MKKSGLLSLCGILALSAYINTYAAESVNQIKMNHVRNSGISFGLVENDGIISRQSLSPMEIEETDYGVRGKIEIISRLAQKEYNFVFELPNNNRLMLPSKEEQDGSILIINGDDILTGAIDPFYVVDVNGKEVPVDVHINGNMLTYTINDLNRSITYPLTGTLAIYGDAHSFSTWFKKGWWDGNRGGWVTLCLEPTEDWHSFDATTAQISWSWSTVKEKFSSSSYWTNETGMYDQYYCHVIGSSQVEDNEWNIEPARPSVGVWETIKAGCNPE